MKTASKEFSKTRLWILMKDGKTKVFYSLTNLDKKGIQIGLKHLITGVLEGKLKGYYVRAEFYDNIHKSDFPFALYHIGQLYKIPEEPLSKLMIYHFDGSHANYFSNRRVDAICPTMAINRLINEIILGSKFGKFQTAIIFNTQTNKAVAKFIRGKRIEI